jgi:hypothetical protein
MSTTGKRVGVFASSGIASVALVHWGGSAPAENRSGRNRKPVAAADPESLAREIAERFGAPSRIVDGSLRVEIANGHRFIAEVGEAFPGSIRSVALHKPTLEDVFLDETGVSIC